jgi:hypothetical protein
MIKPDITEEWMTLTEAMNLLETSRSTIERLTAAGKLESKLIPAPHRRRQRVFLVKSLQNLKAKPEPPRTRAERPKANIGNRQFLFYVGEGPVSVGIPITLSRASITAAIEFLQLIIRQLTGPVQQL